MRDILKQLEEIKTALNLLAEKINEDKTCFFHKNNTFNKKCSVISGSFDNFSVFAERLNENIQKSIELNQTIQKRNKLEDRGVISEEDQKLRRQSSHLDHLNQVDFKALYVFAKIFLDNYTDLLSFVLAFNTKGVRFLNSHENSSVTTLFYSLDKYSGKDSIVLAFKDRCLKRLKAINIFLTQYRDIFIVHANVDGSVGTWFINHMDGGVRFLTQRPSVTPKELIFVVKNFIVESVGFVVDNKVNVLHT